MAAREPWVRQDVEQLQLSRINEIWAHAIEHVPHYRELAATERLPARFDDLEHVTASLPILPKALVRDRGGRFLSERAEPGHWHRTSGSSGTPTAVYRSDAAHRAALRAQYRFQQSWGVDFLDRWVFLWGNGGALAPGFAGWKARVRVPVEDRLRRRLRLSPYDLSPDVLRTHLERIRRFGPVAIYAHSMAAHMLAVEAERTGIELPTLQLVVLTAEPVRDTTRDTVERVFGVPAVVEYGCNESGIIAFEATDRTLRVRDDHVWVETIPRSDGRHDIVVTVLDNPSFPLLRYALGDVTDQPIDRPETGFSILANVSGRDFDLVVSADGRVLHGQAVEDLVDKYDGIRRWRLRQDSSGRVRLIIEGERSSGHTELHRRVEGLVGGFPVVLEHVDALDPISAGKHRTVVSELAPTAVETTSSRTDGRADRS